jgi:hypothetical protein
MENYNIIDTDPTQAYYDNLNAKLKNPFNITKEMAKQMPAPRNMRGGRWIQRVMAPCSMIYYNMSEQPRDKLIDVKHIQKLKQLYEVHGFDPKQHPPVVTKSKNSTSDYILQGLGGWHTQEVYSHFGQEFAIYDVYEYDTPFDARCAKSETNPPAGTDTRLPMTIQDYTKEVCTAVAAGEIGTDKESLRQAIYRIVPKIKDDHGNDTDKVALSKSTITKIEKGVFSDAQVIANFRTYNSKARSVSKNSVPYFCQDQGVPLPGTKNAIKQCCITAFVSNTNNNSTWARGWENWCKYGVPIILFAYLETRNGDKPILEYRQKLLDEFIKKKQVWSKASLRFAGVNNTKEKFPIIFGGFLPQNIMPDNNKGGQATETTLVDVEGNAIEFNPEMRCLSESSNIGGVK